MGEIEVMKEIVRGEDINMGKHVFPQYFCLNLKSKCVSLYKIKFEKFLVKIFKFQIPRF